MRLIITPSIECASTCRHCYYKWRSSEEKSAPTLDVLNTNIYKESKEIDIGFNGIATEIEIIEKVLKSNKEVLVTLNSKVLDRFVTITDRINGPEITCISVSSNTNYKDVMKYSLTHKTILNILDTDVNNIISTIESNLPYLHSTSIYLLMEKGPVTTDNTSWKMNSKRLDDYLIALEKLSEVCLGNINILADECIGIGKGNCCDEWIEIGPHGETRTCPYSINPCTDKLMCKKKE